MPDLSSLSICFVAGTLGQGGAERQLFYVLRTLAAQGARVRLLSLTQGEFWEVSIRRLGVPVIWIGKSANPLLRLLAVARELRADPPRIVQSQHFFMNPYAALAARSCGAVGLGAIRNDGRSEVAEFPRLVGDLMLALPDFLVANSDAGKRFAVRSRIPARRVLLLNNVVDTSLFEPRILHAGQSACCHILWAGRLARSKRTDRFLRALSLLVRQGLGQFEASIAGDGPLRQALETQAASLGLTSPPVVRFIGAVADIAPLFQASDIFVSTSDWEGTPNVVLEAMASGLPVVATDVGGVRDLVQDGETGFLVPLQDEEELVLDLARLMRDPEMRKRMGQKGRLQVERYHSISLLPLFLRGLYKTVLEKEARAHETEA